YSARDFERHMILNMLMLSSLMTGGQDTYAYSQQASSRAAEIRTQLAAAARQSQPSPGETDASAASSQIQTAAWEPPSAAILMADGSDEPLALAMYLTAMLQSESPTRHAETTAALNDLSVWNRRYSNAIGDPAETRMGTTSTPGHGTLHVLAFVGQAPEWVPEPAEPTSAALLVADRILTVTGKHTLPPTIAPVTIGRPQTVGRAIPSSTIHCRLTHEQTSAGDVIPAAQRTTESLPEFLPLVDLQATAEASYHEHRDEEIGRAIARRIVKKGTVYVLKETQQVVRNSFVDLAINIAGIMWEATERPDTRAWRMLPARIDLSSVELPQGTWNAELRTDASMGGTSAYHLPVHIQDGRNTLVICFIPDGKLAGNLLVGGADRATIPLPGTDQ
ncbi:MAG: hypothetical protein KDA85_16085, partial [Planctomycetaceae bacterium]|nr:hypothetical protein [Planctomycetaceae bacterium]